MGVLGARMGDLVNCLMSRNPDSPSCRRVYFGYFLWPKVQKMLEELELIRTPIPPGPWPEPDPPPDWLLHELVPVLLAPYLGEPNPQPSMPARFRLETTIKFRDGLKGLVKELDQEIKELEQHTKG